MKKLRSFETKTGQVTGTGFAFLAGSPDLEAVALDGGDFTDAAIEPLVALRKIRSLVIVSNARIQLARFADFASLPVLEILACGAIPPGQPGPFTGLAKARKLKDLSLTDCPLNFDRAEAVAALPDLATLYITGKQGPALAKLEKLQKLTTLTLLNAPEAAAHLGFIGKLRKLETLTLDGAEAPGLAAAAGAPALRTITLGGVPSASIATDEALKTIATSFPRLETLNFADFSKRDVTPAGIRALAALPKFKTVSWGKIPLPVEIAAALAELPALESLIIGGCEVTEIQLAEIAKSKTITKLDIAHQKLMPAAVEALKKMRGLRDLFVYNCNLSTDDLAALRKALPRCNVRDG